MRLFVPLFIASNFRRFLCTESVENMTVKSALSHWTDVFTKAGVSEPECSIEHIMAHVLGENRIAPVYKRENEILSEKQKALLEKFCKNRLARMPVQYIIGKWSFRFYEFLVSPPVFIPRPETEELIDVILKYYEKNSHLSPKCFLEVGCGTGVISLSLLRELPGLEEGYAFDQSYLACAVTANNAVKFAERRLTVTNSILTENGTVSLGQNRTDVHENVTFDFIVSNPPYIPRGSIANLQPEIKMYEDLRAIDGGPDGMDIIKPLMMYSSRKLINSGSLFMEIDVTQPKLIKEWIELNHDKYKLRLVKVYKDIDKKDRFVHIIREN